MVSWRSWRVSLRHQSPPSDRVKTPTPTPAYKLRERQKVRVRSEGQGRPKGQEVRVNSQEG